MYILSMIVLIFFAIIGLCAFVTAMIDLSCRSSGRAVLILQELKANDAEVRIRSAARICQKHRDVRLVCIGGADDAAAKICRMMQKEYPFVEVMTAEEVKKQFN